MAERQSRAAQPPSISGTTLRPSPSPGPKLHSGPKQTSRTRSRSRFKSTLTSHRSFSSKVASSRALGSRSAVNTTASPGSSSQSDSAPSKSRWLLSQDYREKLPHLLTRFIGYRPPGAVPPYDPLPFPPFSWLVHVDLKYEVWLFAFVGSLGAILLVEAICATNTVFREAYGSPMVVTSFGAAAVLLFGVIESPLAQPRNHVLGNFVGSLVGTAITRLFLLNGHDRYLEYLENTAFHGSTFINGGLVVSVTLLLTLMLGVVHPPAGATALAAATDIHVIPLSWRYLPVVLASSVLLIGWALIINNLGRRRYPVYWWTPQRTFVVATAERTRESEELALKTLEEGRLRQAEDGGRSPEDLLVRRIEGQGGRREDIETASDGAHGSESWEGVDEPLSKVMSRGDRRRASVR